jgi:hydrogenase expression/formation protein HypE
MTSDEFSISCPAPHTAADTIQLAHGGGGRTMAQLLDSVFRPAFANPMLARQHDGAAFELAGRCAFTTDCFVVKPLFFPGGDIGKLAVCGTVNDLAMCGARPLYLSAGFILEEGLDLETLRRVVVSMREAAKLASVQVITGDIKVVDRGMADGIFINTAGVGHIIAPLPVEPQSVRPGDAVILSGDIARHGMAVMMARHGFDFETEIESDCAPLAAPVLALLEAGVELHCLRDLTRGGLASALVEIAETAGVAIKLEEQEISVRDDVRSACELLGLDPLHVANEGRFAAFVAARDAERAVGILRRHEVSRGAVVVGDVAPSPAGGVSSRGILGRSRAIDMLSGEQLPRIC